MADYTLLQLMNLVEHASGEVVGPDKRQRPDVVQMLLSESLAQYWMALTDGGHPYATTRATLTTTATTTDALGWPANSYVSLPADFMALLSARIQSTNGGWVKMHAYGETDVESVDLLFSSDTTGMPVEFRLGTASDATDIMRLRPYAAGVYTIEVIYVPKPTVLGPGDTARMIPGTADWVICDTAMKVLESVGVPEANQAQALMSRKNQAHQVLTDYAHRKNRAGPTGMQDTRAQTRGTRANSLFR